VIRRVLGAASLVFGLIVRLRFWLYEKSLLRRAWPGCLVISIGNITVGGTGKTPVVETFARALAAGGRKVAVISRGYKSRSPSWRWRWRNRTFATGTKVVHDGKQLLLGAREAGDEPYMLARNLGNVIVITDPDRVRGSRFAIREFGVDTILLDDGMQHIRLQRQIEVVLIDAACPFGYGYLLPRGLLREPVTGLKRASHIFLTKTEGRDLAPTIERIKAINPAAEIIACFYEPVGLVNVHTGEQRPLSDLEGQNVFIMTGIAQPEGFVELVKRLGAIVQRVYTYPDHHRFRVEEIEHVYKRAANWHTDAILVTEKDAVRFSKKAGAKVRPCPVWYLKVAVKIQSGNEEFTDCILRICYP
jgi:tetraacyldisaccharide 4'-kinase